MTVKIYITRDCLNAGITEDTIYKRFNSGVLANHGGHFHDGEYHMTRDVAVAHANVMRVAELERARAYVTKLEKLRFEDSK